MKIVMLKLKVSRKCYISGYGNIAPKTKWGRIVTMIYATFGMPIFLMWASNMGTLLAQERVLDQ